MDKKQTGRIILIQNNAQRVSEKILGHFIDDKGQVCRLVDCKYPHPEAPAHAHIQRLEIHIMKEKYELPQKSASILLHHNQVVVAELFKNTEPQKPW